MFLNCGFSGPDRSRMRLFKEMLEWFSELDSLDKAGELGDPQHLATMRFIFRKKFKSLKKAFEFFDFNQNRVLAYIEFCSGIHASL